MNQGFLNLTGRGLLAIATECGIARARAPELVRQIIELHAAASVEPQPYPPLTSTVT